MWANFVDAGASLGHLSLNLCFTDARPVLGHRGRGDRSVVVQPLGARNSYKTHHLLLPLLKAENPE